MGTPGYMSPEQWDDPGDVDGRADVFSLGATIYLALTHELPYGKQRISPADPLPTRPSRRCPRLSADFDAVILKALEPDRERRYRSAAELQDDWHRARTGLLPKATRPRPTRYLARWVRRRAWGLASIGIASTLLATAGIALLRPYLATPPADPPRTVDLITKPPGARFVLVPLDDQTGEPDPGRIIRPGRGATTPARLLAPPGDYLVEVAWPDGRFHEVYRHVSKPGEKPGVFRHTRWSMHGEVVRLPAIEIPPVSVLDRMTYFDGKAGFVSGSPIPGRSPRGPGLAPYYLDPYEVTVRDLLNLKVEPLAHLGARATSPDNAVRSISWDEATHYIEWMGKRLPTDAEYEFAATGGGTRRFPGVDPDPYLKNGIWALGPVGVPDYDRTDTNPPVFGLYSNVAEWTSSWLTSDSGFVRDSSTTDSPSQLRIVRGGPRSVVRGAPDPSEFATWPLKLRIGERRGIWPPGVGFRGARSARPRFLDDGGPAPSP